MIETTDTEQEGTDKLQRIGFRKDETATEREEEEGGRGYMRKEAGSRVKGTERIRAGAAAADDDDEDGDEKEEDGRRKMSSSANASSSDGIKSCSSSPPLTDQASRIFEKAQTRVGEGGVVTHRDEGRGGEAEPETTGHSDNRGGGKLEVSEEEEEEEEEEARSDASKTSRVCSGRTE